VNPWIRRSVILQGTPASFGDFYQGVLRQFPVNDILGHIIYYRYCLSVWDFKHFPSKI